MPENESSTGTESEKVIRVTKITSACIIVGALSSILYSSQAATPAQFLSVTGVALAVAGAALLAGGLLGFLFGIPRTLQHDASGDVAHQPNANPEQKDASRDNPYRPNTNLEQISDWLTKILVGVGLTQLASLPGALQNYADYTASGLGDFPNSKVFAIAILIYFLIWGFLISFLWTRLYLIGAFRQADLSAIGGKLAQVEKKVGEMEKQAEIDARALSIVQRQLNPAPGSQPTPPEEIEKAIKLASDSVREQVFYQAQAVRSENWEELQTKPKMERTIPVFRALIASDTDNVYYANHGQLGLALKDQRDPDWKEAEAELTKAIEMRGPYQKYGWLMYEFNRALCRINLDSAYNQEQPSDEKIKQIILADLRAVATYPELLELIAEDPTTKKWMNLNEVSLSKSALRGS